MEELVGKQFKKILIDQSKEYIVFETDEGDRISYYADGDCCSNSWIEHLTGVQNILGAKIVSIVDSGEVSSFECDEYDHVSVYKTTVNTNKGSCDLEYRNSSNGYYGGNLVPSIPPTNLEWKEVTEDF